ncbi:MAG TPA: ATP phosphoribosyltransferase [Aggregatilineaceae bacterium]|nr:ATP phosphoribosyltransferase [Aggregatilineaceae bacterium]
MTDNHVTLALPSKGAIAEPTLEFLRSCDLHVVQSNPRQYTATIPSLPQVDVLFQRVTDIVYKVAEGSVDMGITGLDVVHEIAGNLDEVIILHDNLRYGYCQLVLAVPEAWIDVDTMADVVDVALDFREHKHRNIRVATKFTNLARQFLHEHGVHHFTLVEAEGAIEAAPTLGYADIIVDLSATGTTLRENHLKPIRVLLDSYACLIGNLRRLREFPEVLDTAHTLLEVIDASLHGRRYYQVRANVRGASAEAVAHAVAAHPTTRGLQGPTVAPIYAANTPESDDGQWYNVTIVVQDKELLDAVAHLRRIGGTQTMVMPLRYVFMAQSPSYQRLMERLQR